MVAEIVAHVRPAGTLPAEATDGDLALLLIEWYGGAPSPAPGWVLAGVDRDSLPVSSRTPFGVSAFARVVSGEWSRATWVKPSGFYREDASLLVVRGPGGIGTSRAYNGVPTTPGGAVLWLYSWYSQFSSVPASTYEPMTLIRDEGGVYELAPETRAAVAFGTESGGYAGATDVKALGLAVELAPRSKPFVPDLLSPGTGVEVPAAGAVEFRVGHRSATLGGGLATGLRLRARPVGGSWSWWDPAAGALVAAETDLPFGTGTVPVPSALFPPGGWEWSAATGEGGEWSDYAAVSTFTMVEPATVTVTGPSTVSEDMSPTITWTGEYPRGGQTGYHARVEGPGVGFDSGQRRGAAGSFTLPAQEGWVNGGTYQALVRVQQVGGTWSGWASKDFVISWTAPATPTVQAAAYAPGVQVAVTAPAGGVVQVERSHGDGWVPVTEGFAAADTGATLVHDVTAPFGVPVKYRARAAAVLDGVRLWSDWVETAAVVSQDGEAYLVDDTDPARFLHAKIGSDDRGEAGANGFVTEGLGNPSRMVDYGTDYGRTGRLTVTAYTPTERDTLTGWLERNMLMRLVLPPEGGEPGEVIRIARAGKWTPARRVQTALVPWRDFTFDWVEVL